METKLETDSRELHKKAKLLGISPPKITIPANVQKDPVKFDKAKKAKAARIDKALTTAIAKAAKDEKRSKLQQRKECLEARFKVVRGGRRSRTYPDQMIKAWIKEYEIIKNNPKLWNKETGNGTRPFPVSVKKNKSAAQLLESMDLD